MSSTKTRFGQVVEFNQEVLNINPMPIGLMKPEDASLSVTQLAEEVEEFMDAYDNKDLLGCIDAIIDSIYFSYGILYKMGLNEQIVNELFTVVHNANMRKRQGVKEGREGHGDAKDATKPEDWVDPRDAMLEILCK